MTGYVLIPRNRKSTCFKEDVHGTSHSILGSGLIPRGKEKDKTRQAVFLTPTNPFGNDPEEEGAHDDCTVPLKVPYVTRWKPYHDAVFWIRLSKAQDQGLEFLQTKSFATMTYATIPGDCIDCVTSQNGDRVLFERLETPRPTPEVTLRQNWQSQRAAAAAFHF